MVEVVAQPIISLEDVKTMNSALRAVAAEQVGAAVKEEGLVVQEEHP